MKKIIMAFLILMSTNLFGSMYYDMAKVKGAQAGRNIKQSYNPLTKQEKMESCKNSLSSELRSSSSRLNQDWQQLYFNYCLQELL